LNQAEALQFDEGFIANLLSIFDKTKLAARSQAPGSATRERKSFSSLQSA
jgi:hypothetical protein